MSRLKVHASWCYRRHAGDCVDGPSDTVAPEWIVLAADIRAVDGNHDLGAGALAEALISRGWTRTLADEGLSDDGLREDDRRFLRWCHERFGVIYGESQNLDWMQRLAALAKETP